MNLNKEWKMSFLESAWYYLSVICTLGVAFTIKVIIKKALSERDAN